MARSGEEESVIEAGGNGGDAVGGWEGAVGDFRGGRQEPAREEGGALFWRLRAVELVVARDGEGVDAAGGGQGNDAG